MADFAFNLNETLLSAKFAEKQRFQGLRNTSELMDSLKDMFGLDIQIEYIQGRPDEFKAKVFCNLYTEDDVAMFIDKLQQNTYITVKKSKLLYKYVS